MQVKFGDYDKRITNLARVENDLQDLVPIQVYCLVGRRLNQYWNAIL